MAVDANNKAHRKLHVVGGIEDGIGRGQGLWGCVRLTTAGLSAASHLPKEGAADHQSSPCLFPGTWVALRDAGLPYVKCGSSSFRMPRQGQG